MLPLKRLLFDAIFKHRSVVWATRETKAARRPACCAWAALPEALNAPLRTFCPRHCSLHCCSAAPVAHTGVDLVSESYVTTAKVRYQFDDSILASRSFLWGLNWRLKKYVSPKYWHFDSFRRLNVYFRWLFCLVNDRCYLHTYLDVFWTLWSTKLSRLGVYFWCAYFNVFNSNC